MKVVSRDLASAETRPLDVTKETLVQRLIGEEEKSPQDSCENCNMD